ncbi:24935_t:CDS:2, partial [Gigaspora rosea]
KSITISTRLQEHPNTFHINNNILICEYCNEPVEWKSKSTVDSHFLSAADIKSEVIEDLIEIFAIADIPLEKVDHLIPFFKKHL